MLAVLVVGVRACEHLEVVLVKCSPTDLSESVVDSIHKTKHNIDRVRARTILDPSTRPRFSFFSVSCFIVYPTMIGDN